MWGAGGAPGWSRDGGQTGAAQRAGAPRGGRPEGRQAPESRRREGVEGEALEMASCKKEASLDHQHQRKLFPPARNFPPQSRRDSSSFLRQETTGGGRRFVLAQEPPTETQEWAC